MQSLSADRKHHPGGSFAKPGEKNQDYATRLHFGRTCGYYVFHVLFLKKVTGSSFFYISNYTLTFRVRVQVASPGENLYYRPQ